MGPVAEQVDIVAPAERRAAVVGGPVLDRLAPVRVFFAEPLEIQLTMVRVVSVWYSTVWGPTIGIRSRQHGATIGCVYTMALRRLSSAKMGANFASPSHRLP